MFFILFSIEFVANHALLVALNLSRITHFWCKFLCSKKAAGTQEADGLVYAYILIWVAKSCGRRSTGFEGVFLDFYIYISQK